MKEYLSAKSICLTPTPEIRALDDKTILIVEGESEKSCLLHVRDADPNSIDVGMCSVIAAQYLSEEVEFPAESRARVIPTATCRSEHAFLSQDALDLIRPRNEQSLHTEELLLIIPK